MTSRKVVTSTITELVFCATRDNVQDIPAAKIDLMACRRWVMSPRRYAEFSKLIQGRFHAVPDPSLTPFRIPLFNIQLQVSTHLPDSTIMGVPEPRPGEPPGAHLTRVIFVRLTDEQG